MGSTNNSMDDVLEIVVDNYLNNNFKVTNYDKDKKELLVTINPSHGEINSLTLRNTFDDLQPRHQFVNLLSTIFDLDKNVCNEKFTNWKSSKVELLNNVCRETLNQYEIIISGQKLIFKDGENEKSLVPLLDEVIKKLEKRDSVFEFYVMDFILDEIMRKFHFSPIFHDIIYGLLSELVTIDYTDPDEHNNPLTPREFLLTFHKRKPCNLREFKKSFYAYENDIQYAIDRWYDSTLRKKGLKIENILSDYKLTLGPVHLGWVFEHDGLTLTLHETIRHVTLSVPDDLKSFVGEFVTKYMADKQKYFFDDEENKKKFGFY